MGARRATLADVAREAGVSKTTASFVLSGREDMRISDDATRRVRDAAADLEYRPNQIASSLRTQVTRTIGLISDSIASGRFAGEVIRGALDATRARGQLLFIAETGGEATAEERLVGGMIDRQVDGLIYATMNTRETELPAALRDRTAVLLNCFASGFAGATILPDEVGAGRSAAGLVLAAGHRRGIHVIGGRHITATTPEGVYAGHARLRGIQESLGEAGTAPEAIAECAWDVPEHGYREVASLLANGARPEALICCNDRLAFGAYQAVREVGLAVGRDVSVVAFDGSELASWLRPRLTSIALPHYELGRRAVETLLGEDAEPGVRRLPMPVHEGNSIVAPSCSPVRE